MSAANISLVIFDHGEIKVMKYNQRLKTIFSFVLVYKP